MRKVTQAVWAFIYEFLIGDTPEFAAGVAVIVVGAWALSRTAGAPTDYIVLPLAVLLLLCLSLLRAAASA